jgi:hypothetical protein
MKLRSVIGAALLLLTQLLAVSAWAAFPIAGQFTQTSASQGSSTSFSVAMPTFTNPVTSGNYEVPGPVTVDFTTPSALTQSSVTSINISPITTTAANEYAIASVGISSGLTITAQNNGWTTEQAYGGISSYQIYNTLTSSGSNSWQATSSASTHVALVALTFAPGAAPPRQQQQMLMGVGASLRLPPRATPSAAAIDEPMLIDAEKLAQLTSTSASWWESAARDLDCPCFFVGRVRRFKLADCLTKIDVRSHRRSA